MRALALAVLVACRSVSGAPDASNLADAAPDEPPDKSAACANTFGSELTDNFGRLDGTILAVVPPGLQTCAQPNSTHLVLQVTMHDAAYRIVANIDTYMTELDAPLAGPAWSDGWHTDATLDYVTTLHVASTAFTPPPAIVKAITDQLELGAHVSVFGTSSGGVNASSAHLIHRNLTGADGAIVIDPETAPHYLLFRFDNQAF